MASTNCWRCLARPSQRLCGSVPTIIPSISSLSSSSSLTPSVPTTRAVTATTTTTGKASFTTSASQHAPPKEPSMSRHFRAGKKLILGRKKRPPPGRPVAPGERKAFRKRILLSNDNALAVEGHSKLDAENIADREAIGSVVSLPNDLVDRLRAVEAFKPTQKWGLFRSPHMLIRGETVEIARRINDAAKNKKTERIVITGEKGSGKSIIGLQAQCNAFLNKWVVINIPEARDLTTAHTEYSPIPHSQMYAQPVYTVKLMQAIHRANQEVLSQHRVEGDHMHLPISVTRNMTLAAMLVATKEPDFAWPVFQAFWQELLRPGRPPVLLATDGVHHAMRVSDYRDPAYKLIHSHDLALVRLYADALGGRTAFPNGAVVLGVTSRGNCPGLPSVEKAIEIAKAIQAGVAASDLPQRDPFERRYDERVFEALRGVSVLDIPGVDKTLARALMEYWAASGVLRQRVDEYAVSEKWTLAGGGVLAEMERVALFDSRISM